MLDFVDKNQVWAFSINTVYTYFDKESEHSIKISLARHEKNGIVKRVAKGLYINPRAKSLPIFKIETIATMLRDFRTFYLSLESVLSETGIISQIPSILTFVSKEKSNIYNTPYGTIEFVKTKKKFNIYDGNFYFDKERGIYIANEEQALNDAYRFGRSIDLIEEQRIKDEKY